MNILDRHLIFVTGKGGVGKTTVAAGLALLAAREGQRVLVCEVDAKGNLAESFEVGALDFEPRLVRPGLFAMTMNTEASLKEYLRLQLRLPLLSRIGPLAHAFDFVATAAPGVKEILTVGKLCWEVKERHYDLVVVDAVATGHIIGQLDAPRSINGLVQVGLVRSQTRWMLDILEDPARTGVMIVTTPEEMPTVETIELAIRLKLETNVRLDAVIVNRALPELFTRAETDVYDSFALGPHADALRGELGPAFDVLVRAADMAISRRRLQASHLGELRAQLDVDVPLLFVPELFARMRGMRASSTIADRLAEEL